MNFLTTLFVGLFLITGISAQAKNKFLTRGSILVPKTYVESAGGTKLTYYGGPVISHVKAVPVFWTSRVHPDIQKVMGEFYAAYVQSKHMDWLTEYNTNVTAVDGRAGTNQVIGRGESVPSILIQPNLTKKQITDAKPYGFFRRLNKFLKWNSKIKSMNP